MHKILITTLCFFAVLFGVLGKTNAITFNGHDYVYVSLPGVDVDEAIDHMTNTLGSNYHLATITSQAEQDFIRTLLIDNNAQGFLYHYLGGFQDPGVTNPSAGWQWVTGETWSYTSWEGGEPNDFYGVASEQILAIRFNQGGWNWNDVPAITDPYSGGYIAESEYIEAVDNDGDGFSSQEDCDDNDDTVSPGAPELCDGKDNNCNDIVDDVLNTYYVDGDSDGYGDPAFPVDLIACTTPVGHSDNSDDCNDLCAECFPGNPEVCDEKDNNCDDQVDEGVTNTYYLDSDADGYGEPNNTTQACSMPNGYVDDNADCDDNDFNVNPSAIEIFGNGIDDNCDGFQPTEATEDLIVIVEELNLKGGIENSLTSKLNNTIKSLEKGQDNAAVNQLNAFINNIEALRGKELTDDEADELIVATQEIISSINSA